MIKPGLVARHDSLDLAKRRGAGQLGEQQADELIARLKTAHRAVGGLFGDNFLEIRPRNQFEDVVKDSIGMAHGVDPFSCPDESRNSGYE
jgi:hypothetical protein